MSTKKGKYGNPRKNRPGPLMGDLLKKADPTGNTDPRTIGPGNIAGPGGSRERNGVLLDMTDVILLGGMEVSVAEIGRQGAWDGERFYLLMHGRVNKTDRDVSLGYLTNTDGVAALLTELLAIAERGGAELLDDLTRRLTELHQGKHVDLYWLKAAIESAIEAQEQG